MTSGGLVLVAGVWVLCQLFGGDVLARLGIGTTDAGTIVETTANLTMPSGEDSAARRDAAATAPPSPAPTYGPH